MLKLIKPEKKELTNLEVWTELVDLIIPFYFASKEDKEKLIDEFAKRFRVFCK